MYDQLACMTRACESEAWAKIDTNRDGGTIVDNGGEQNWERGDGQVPRIHEYINPR